MATKYSGATALIFVLAACVLARGSGSAGARLRRVALCVVLFGLAALAANPYFLLDDAFYLRDFLRLLLKQPATVAFGQWGTSPWLRFGRVLSLGCGWAPLGLALAGGIALLARRPYLPDICPTGYHRYGFSPSGRSLCHGPTQSGQGDHGSSECQNA